MTFCHRLVFAARPPRSDSAGPARGQSRPRSRRRRSCRQLLSRRAASSGAQPSNVRLSPKLTDSLAMLPGYSALWTTHPPTHFPYGRYRRHPPRRDRAGRGRRRPRGRPALLHGDAAPRRRPCRLGHERVGARRGRRGAGAAPRWRACRCRIGASRRRTGPSPRTPAAPLDLAGLALRSAHPPGQFAVRQYDAEIPFGLLDGEHRDAAHRTESSPGQCAARPSSHPAVCRGDGGFARWAGATLTPTTPRRPWCCGGRAARDERGLDLDSYPTLADMPGLRPLCFSMQPDVAPVVPQRG